MASSPSFRHSLPPRPCLAAKAADRPARTPSFSGIGRSRRRRQPGVRLPLEARAPIAPHRWWAMR
ncbi:MAG: hypothetical protein Q7U53_15315 [Anaerolineaceae bacterium]|nr:hypothetical protein [Anaerolineaceae bacterium]